MSKGTVDDLEHPSKSAAFRFRTPFPASARLKVIAISACVIVLLSGTAFFVFAKRASSPISRFAQSAGFPLFTASPLPSGVTYEGQASMSNGVVAFALRSGYGRIDVSEQAAPADAPNLAETSNFTTSQVTAGTAYTGSASGMPVVVIVSNTTLITVDADSSVPSALLTQLTKNLVPLPH
jgi:hypothetical protein